ncbi:HAT, C-terminal dimerization domain [Dillenia turbinata]|uniref:HAT, C-terminal dimerization domain n=1 Tax=Dillenia turbinata TaxID=194707 RepID=A0AAN8VT48_9MAGN
MDGEFHKIVAYGLFRNQVCEFALEKGHRIALKFILSKKYILEISPLKYAVLFIVVSLLCRMPMASSSTPVDAEDGVNEYEVVKHLRRTSKMWEEFEMLVKGNKDDSKAQCKHFLASDIVNNGGSPLRNYKFELDECHKALAIFLVDGMFPFTTVELHGFRVIHLKVLPTPCSGIPVADEVLMCLAQWNMENKTFSITLDDASYSDVMISSLKRRFLEKKFLHCDGLLFQVRCCNHFLKLIVKASLDLVEARDILTVPVSSISPEFAFSIGKKLINPCRSTLKSKIISSSISPKLGICRWLSIRNICSLPEIYNEFADGSPLGTLRSPHSIRIIGSPPTCEDDESFSSSDDDDDQDGHGLVFEVTDTFCIGPFMLHVFRYIHWRCAELSHQGANIGVNSVVEIFHSRSRKCPVWVSMAENSIYMDIDYLIQSARRI